MIISENPNPSIEEFRSLMARTDKLLNEDARRRAAYYKGRGGNPLEDDVKDALDECAKGTPFENTIEKISGHRFPDIVASKYYGVEVKSTKENHWTSTGSSILESTRVADVERIYMTFGKLGGNPIEFISRPYEECLYGIAVTHMPRYLINMQLDDGETIFDKMGIPYDELRKADNPIAPVSKYYRSQLKEGESLWWAGDYVDETVPAKVRLWKTLSPEEKNYFTMYGCLNFPEVFNGVYDQYVLWLTTKHGVVDPHIRDQFSAGGREDMLMSNGEIVSFPAIYRRVKRNLSYFIQMVAEQEEEAYMDSVLDINSPIGQRLIAWCDTVSRLSNSGYDESMDALMTMIFGNRIN